MKSFLQRLAEEIAARYGDDPGQLCVVLPNRRAGVFLKKYLASTLKKTTWSPRVYSIEDFITHISGLQIIDPAGLLFEFYQVHKTIHGADSQDFEVFADWAQVLLRDFDEVDQNLVDPEKIFTYLNAARAITVWNLEGQALTDQEKNYIEFYNSFLDYYRKLKDQLLAKNSVYKGLAYRTAEEKITQNADIPWEKVFFAGLNALSTGEEKIISHLIQINKAEIFWDADDYYISDLNQEAGSFIREYLNKWTPNPVKWIEQDFRSTKKSIKVFGIPRNMGQATKAGQIIQELKTKDKGLERTALVLADEKLLLPVLYSLPDDLGPVNVTMGYPFRYTHLYQLTSLFIRMHENAEKFAGQRKSADRPFYVKDILKILSHPYTNLFAGNDGKNPFDHIGETIRQKNRVFLHARDILKIIPEVEDEARHLLSKLFTVRETPGQVVEGIIEAMELIRDRIILLQQSQNSDRELDLEYLFHLSGIIKRIRGMMDTYPFVTTLKTLHKIMFQVLDNSRLPFTGEPLQGLQVMGVLETRALDFDNIILLSANEGIIPSGRLPNSFIPFDIKVEFGLPTFRHNDAVFAYHFYRMLQRASNIYLLYDTEGDAMKGGEKSRFIIQSGFELRNYNPVIDFEEKLLSPAPPEMGRDISITVAKSDTIMTRLMEKAGKGFSPSALNLYIKCPLQFYFQEILGVSEAESIEETIEAKTMGSVIHQVFENIFTPFTGKYIDPDELTKKQTESEKLVQQAFREYYGEGDLEHGKNHLIYKVTLFLVNQFLKQEAENIRSSAEPATALRIISLEEMFQSNLKCSPAGMAMEVKIKGKTDRIDQWEDTVRIIDYKTGSVQSSELNVKDWESLTGNPEMAKAFQLLLYAYLFFRNGGSPHGKIESGNISLRKISEGFKKVKLPEGQEINKETLDVFEGYLVALLEQVLDPLVPFIQTEDVKNCTYCPFTSICTR